MNVANRPVRATGSVLSALIMMSEAEGAGGHPGYPMGYMEIPDAGNIFQAANVLKLIENTENDLLGRIEMPQIRCGGCCVMV